MSGSDGPDEAPSPGSDGASSRPFPSTSDAGAGYSRAMELRPRDALAAGLLVLVLFALVALVVAAALVG